MACGDFDTWLNVQHKNTHLLILQPCFSQDGQHDDLRIDFMGLKRQLQQCGSSSSRCSCRSSQFRVLCTSLQVECTTGTTGDCCRLVNSSHPLPRLSRVCLALPNQPSSTGAYSDLRLHVSVSSSHTELNSLLTGRVKGAIDHLDTTIVGSQSHGLQYWPRNSYSVPAPLDASEHRSSFWRLRRWPAADALDRELSSSC